MKVCPNCRREINEGAMFCPICGTSFRETAPIVPPSPPQPKKSPSKADPFDHTEEFSSSDRSGNKLAAMSVYLFGFVGIILALLIAKDSPYVKFHVRQGMKFAILEALAGIAALFLFWTILVPIAAAVLLLFLAVMKLICFFQVCSGRAKEPLLIRRLKFLQE